MSTDDFSTVNVRGGDRAREIERIRQHYREHRTTLDRLASEAPTQHLAEEYQRIIREIEVALLKLDELEGRAGPTEPGTKPLVTPPSMAAAPASGPQYAEEENPLSRVALIVAAGVIVLALIGWLIWRASSGRADRAAAPIEDGTATAAAPADTAPATIEPVPSRPAADVLTIRPALADYGTVRKGTRATRQFEVTNTTAGAIPITVSRSRCRCLYYEYAGTVAARGKESITVTIDGARAKEGPLRETIEVRSKKGADVLATFEVAASIE